MKILIIRHGEPDYENDTLTEKGRREAECLADHLAKVLDGQQVHFYMSPYGRARDTTSLTLKGLSARPKSFRG